jgi:dTDP-4-amino-4,6-dideoxygalactose transaminase
MNWISRKYISNEIVNKYLLQTSQTNIFTNYGPIVQELEIHIQNKFQIDSSKTIICCNNATSALYALTSGISIFHEKELQWATQSFTFPSSAQGMLKTTYIIDIDKEGGIDLDSIPLDADGIIVTNVFGTVVNIEKYEKWCKEHAKFLVFDNAGTPYTFYKGKNSSNYGNGSIISFHHTKQFGFGEGGAIIVDKKYETSIRRLLNFGIDPKNKWCRVGSNYKMSEISAIYILQYIITMFDKIVKKHKNIYNFFKLYMPEYMYPNFADEKTTVPMCIPLLNSKFTIEFKNKILEHGIFCRKYYQPLENTSNSIDTYNKILCFPCNIDINLKEYKELIKFINNE